MKKELFTIMLILVLVLCGVSVIAAPDLQTLSGPHYIMDDTFSQIITYNNMPVLSAWDVDNSAGSVVSSQNEEWFKITDESKTTRSRISKQLVSHDKGMIVYETSLKFGNASKGSYLKISGDGGTKDVVRLDILKNTIFYKTPVKPETISAFKFNIYYALKLYIDLDARQTTVYFDGKKIDTYPFTDDVSNIDFIELSTAEEYTASIYVNGMKMYTGFELNEQFFAVKPGEVPEEWTVQSGIGVEVITERTYSASWPDMYCMKFCDNSAVSCAKASRKFNALSKHASFEFKYATEADGAEFDVAWKDDAKDIFEFSFMNNEITFNGKKIQNFVKNVWYSTIVEADFDTHTADIYINEILVAEGVSFTGEKVDTVCASTRIKSRSEVWFDDLRAFAVNEPADEEYVPVPVAAESDDFVVGMQTCDMWREGWHLGYDFLNAHPDRIPLMGFYDEGSRAVADWETKMMVEHGIDFRMSCWFVPRNYTGGPIKMGSNAFDLYEGYLRGKYSDMLDYAILWEGAAATQVDATNFKEYVVPFWVEHYFKDPRYLVIDNKPVIFIYLADMFYKYVGGGDEAVARECIQYLRDACKEIGFDDAYIICSRSSESEVYVEKIGADGMYNYSYSISEIVEGAQEANLEKTKNMYQQAFVLPAITQGRQESAWLRYGKNDGKFMSVEGFKNALEYVRNDFYKDCDHYPVSEKLVMIDTWNEYGEGHLVAPCNLAGFDYLDAVRDVFTAGTRHEDQLPDDAQKTDYGILYPKDREPLKVGESMSVPIPTTVYKKFSGSDFELWQKDKQIENGRVEDGLLKGDCIGIDPSVISPAGLDIDLQNITYVHVRMNQISGSKSTTLYFITEDDQKWNEAKGLTFTPDVEGGMCDVYFPMWQKSTWEGKLVQFRIDPLNALGSFEIESVEFLRGSPEDFVNIVLDGNKLPLSSIQTGVVKLQSLPLMRNDKVYLPMRCYSAYFNIKAIYIADEHKIRLIHDIYNLDIDVETGDTTLNDEPCESVPFVLHDNQYFVAARESLERLGYKIGWEQSENAMLVTTPPPAPLSEKSAEPLGQWNFNVDDDMQGWTTSSTIAMASVSDGVLTLEASTSDPALTCNNLNFAASQFTTLRFAIKNGTKSNLSQMFFTTDKDSKMNEAKSYRVTIDTMNENFVEYEVDLASNSAWTDTITSLRFDPTAGVGDVAIDYIVLSND